MSKPSPPRYRTANWSEYDAALRKRGPLSVWFDPGMVWHARTSGERGCPAAIARSDILRATRHLDRTHWKTCADSHVRRRIEARVNRPKLFGETIMSRAPDHQTAEIHLHIAIMNAVPRLGRAEIKAVARVQAAKPRPTPAPDLCNIADARYGICTAIRSWRRHSIDKSGSGAPLCNICEQADRFPEIDERSFSRRGDRSTAHAELPVASGAFETSPGRAGSSFRASPAGWRAGRAAPCQRRRQ
ncbi:hypothetical protein ATI53_10759 [Salipiger aestuarii]|uniref:DDE family transposase n=1 Tax=Salipiger aestuarii TaxID=568098 RepID=A0A327XJT5_9RHOB|nr:hypothetical protein ATI53_10759 [Salipiger aestuarii]